MKIRVSYKTQILASRIVLYTCMAVLIYSYSAAGQDCRISATGCNFGEYDTQSNQPTNGEGNISVTCDPSNTSIMNVRIDAGSNSGGNFNPRVMKSAEGALKYNLYRDTARKQIWGDGTGGTYTQSGHVNNNFYVFGQIPTGQLVPTGNYSDFVTITIEW